MLTSKRSGSVSPEEVDNGSDTRVSAADGNGSVTSNACRNDSLPEEFLSSRRIGRRNALTYAESGMVDLPDRFEELSVETDEPSTEGRNSSTPGTSKQQH
ncbi:uncharacterized protein LOC117602799 isoform X1 [Osmia lignaria lignaria]|uniref:uncharacterized protein LOC117602799 isoform X1 n=1 Tax=Osmia lignaria lignaria TaxID=1437193 RepID=UPI001478F04B|nr:uncharacterized protein LOC117602799 isoform X1 [Osmia lignaria]XP_034177168.1 uncharacterized protein LOC117602799 isoform X1 [Osmia lignaria]